MVAAVWRVRLPASPTAAAGHPFAVNDGTVVRFGYKEWIEGLGVGVPRTVVTNLATSVLAVYDGLVCCAVWDFQPASGTLRWSLATQDGQAGAWVGAVSGASESSWRTGPAPVVNGMGGTRSLDLAELLVWNRSLSANERAGVVQGYLGPKWGFSGSSLLDAATYVIPVPVGAVFAHRLRCTISASYAGAQYLEATTLQARYNGQPVAQDPLPTVCGKGILATTTPRCSSSKTCASGRPSTRPHPSSPMPISPPSPSITPRPPTVLGWKPTVRRPSPLN